MAASERYFRWAYVLKTICSDHPKLLAFVTHCGMNSVQESSMKGVPMICIPLFAEQLRNAKMIEYREIGVSLDKDAITTEVFIEAIKEVIENDK